MYFLEGKIPLLLASLLRGVHPWNSTCILQSSICAMVKSRYIGDGHPTFNRNPYNGYINPYYWVDDHPLLYGNNGSLDPSTYILKELSFQTTIQMYQVSNIALPRLLYLPLRKLHILRALGNCSFYRGWKPFRGFCGKSFKKALGKDPHFLNQLRFHGMGDFVFFVGWTVGIPLYWLVHEDPYNGLL